MASKKNKRARTQRLSSAPQGTGNLPLRGLIISRAGKEFIVETLAGPDQGQRQICRAKQQLELLVGDVVHWEKTQNDKGWILAHEPRSNLIERFAGAHSTKRMAANVSALVIIIAPRPTPSAKLIDQYLVAAHLCQAEPIMVLNKADLLQGEQDKAQALLSFYTGLGFTCCAISTKANRGLDTLAKLLAPHTAILLGQSGVGKSSLVKAWLPDEQIRVGAISEHTALGKHTTSNSTLYHLPTGGKLIDAPGIREFKLSGRHPHEALAQAFPDIEPLMHQCRFRNCSHRHEPDCALKASVKAGNLSEQRLADFLVILNEFGQ